MKTLTTSLALLLAVAIFLPGCTQTPDSPAAVDTSKEIPLGKSVAPNANPAWVFSSSTTYRGNVVDAVSVSDVTGANNDLVYTGGVTGARTWFHTWSPSGASVSFVEMPPVTANSWYTGIPWGAYAIKAVDVSVTKGVAAGSKVRTIYSVTAADSLKIVSQAWCPSTTGSGAGLIAYMIHTPTMSKIYTVPVTGGASTLVYSVTLTNSRLDGGTLTWSGDGTKLAFVQFSGTNTADASVECAITIIDLSGAVQATLLGVSSKHISGLRWSNSGLDLLAYQMSDVSTPANADFDLYTIGTAAGSTATKVLSSAYTPFWSPDNSELVCTLDAAGTYRINLATGVKTSVGFAPYGDWK